MGSFGDKLHSAWTYFTDEQRDVAKLIIGIVVLGGIGSAAYIWGRKPIRLWQRDKALAAAREFIAKKDYASALSALRRAADRNPNDIEVWRQVADFLGSTGSPDVLVARRNLVELSPDDLSLRLGFVVDALRYGDVMTARDVYSGVRDGEREEVAFFRMAAAIAYATGQTDVLEKNLDEILKRSPGDRQAMMDLVLIQLWGADADKARAAKSSALELLKNPEVRVRGSVELLKYTARNGAPADMRELVSQLNISFFGRPPPAVNNPNPNEPPGWIALVEGIKQQAAGSAQEAAMVARWLSSLGQTREALVWIDTLGEGIRRSPLVSAAALELSIIIDDADRLRVLLLNGAWGRAAPETVDLAFASRWQRRLGHFSNAQATWGDALASAGNSISALRVLTRLATAWGNNDDAQAAMQLVIVRFPYERWAWEALRLEYSRRQDSPKLFELYDKWVRAQPDNRVVAEDWIVLGLLLDHTTPAMLTRARTLRQTDPESAVARLGYALSLRTQHHPAEALAQLNILPDADKQLPRIALWRGVLLLETGDKTEARATLNRIDHSRLLPEEVAIWREFSGQAAAPVVRPRPTPPPPRPKASTPPPSSAPATPPPAPASTPSTPSPATKKA